MINPLIYLMGPISGVNLNGALAWREYAQRLLSPEIRVLDPMRGKKNILPDTDEKLGFDYTATPSELVTPAGIVNRDLMDIKRCDLVLANFLDASEISIGSCVEVGIAIAYNKPLVLTMEAKNIHRHPFITYKAMFLVEELSQAIDLVKITFG